MAVWAPETWDKSSRYSRDYILCCANLITSKLTINNTLSSLWAMLTKRVI